MILLITRSVPLENPTYLNDVTCHPWITFDVWFTVIYLGRGSSHYPAHTVVGSIIIVCYTRDVANHCVVIIKSDPLRPQASCADPRRIDFTD